MLEREYNVPLRKEFQKVARYKKAAKAMRALKEFLSKHMKSDSVLIGRKLNEKIWEKGIKNPPHHVSVIAKKDDEGVVKVELKGFDWVEPIRPIKREEKKSGLAGKLQELKESEKEEETKEEKPEPKKTDNKEDKSANEEKTPKAKPSENKNTEKNAETDQEKTEVSEKQ